MFRYSSSPKVSFRLKGQNMLGYQAFLNQPSLPVPSERQTCGRAVPVLPLCQLDQEGPDDEQEE
jgi:hypothetical protein